MKYFWHARRWVCVPSFADLNIARLSSGPNLLILWNTPRSTPPVSSAHLSTTPIQIGQGPTLGWAPRWLRASNQAVADWWWLFWWHHSVCRRHWGRYKSPLVLKSCSTPALGLLPTQYWISNTKSYIIYTSYKQYDILNNKYIAARRNLDVQMSDMPRPSPPVEKNVTTPEVAKNKSSVKGKPAKGDTKATKGKLKKTTLADLDASGIMDWQVRLFTRKFRLMCFTKK